MIKSGQKIFHLVENQTFAVELLSVNLKEEITLTIWNRTKEMGMKKNIKRSKIKLISNKKCIRIQMIKCIYFISRSKT